MFLNEKYSIIVEYAAFSLEIMSQNETLKHRIKISDIFSIKSLVGLHHRTNIFYYTGACSLIETLLYPRHSVQWYADFSVLRIRIY